MQHEQSEMKNGVTPWGIAIALIGGVFGLIASIGLFLVIANVATNGLQRDAGDEIFEGLTVFVAFGMCSAALISKSRASVRAKSDSLDLGDNVLLRMAYASGGHDYKREAAAWESARVERIRRREKWLEKFLAVVPSIFLPLMMIDVAMRAHENPTPIVLLALAGLSVGSVGAMWSLWREIRRRRAE
jgi:hypothetical protein